MSDKTPSIRRGADGCSTGQSGESGRTPKKNSSSAIRVSIFVVISVLLFSAIFGAAYAIVKGGAATLEIQEEETEPFTMLIGDTRLTMNLPATWKAEQEMEDGLVRGTTEEGFVVSYSDSAVPTGDDNAIVTEWEIYEMIYGEDTEMTSFHEESYNGFALTCVDGEKSKVIIYQDIGASIYLKIDIRVENIVLKELTDRFCINLENIATGEKGKE